MMSVKAAPSSVSAGNPAKVPQWKRASPLSLGVGGPCAVLPTLGQIRLCWAELRILPNFFAQGILWGTLPNCALMIKLTRILFVFCFVFWKRGTI